MPTGTIPKVEKIPITDAFQLSKFGFQWQSFFKASHHPDDVGGYEWHGPCPVCHGDDRCSVSNGLWYCRKNGHSGILSRMGNYKPSAEERQKARERAKRKRERDRRDRQRKLRKINKSRVWEAYHRSLVKIPEYLEMLENDGIPLRLVEKYQIGYCPEHHAKNPVTGKYIKVKTITFPHINPNGYCVNIRHRVLHPDFQKSKYRPHRTNLPIAFFDATHGAKWAVFVEGEKKAIVLADHGIPAIGLWGIHTYREKWIPWFKKQFKKRFVVYDADNWGVIKSAWQLANKLEADLYFPPGKPDDLLVSGQMSAGEFKEELKDAIPA